VALSSRRALGRPRGRLRALVTHQYVNPLVAIALGTLFLGERLPAATIAGAVLIVGSVYVAVRTESPARATLGLGSRHGEPRLRRGEIDGIYSVYNF
jgi:hypothetical protein